MNWEEEAFGMANVQPPTPNPTPKSVRAPAFEAAAFDTPRSGLATFESFFPFSTSPLQGLAETDDPDNPERGHPDALAAAPADSGPAKLSAGFALMASAPVEAGSTPRPGVPASASATPTQPSSTGTLVQVSQADPTALGAVAQPLSSTITNPNESFVCRSEGSMYTPPPTRGSTEMQGEQPGGHALDGHSMPGEEQPQDSARSMQLKNLPLSPRPSRYSEFSPDLLEAFGYTAPAAVTASEHLRRDLMCGPNDSFIADEFDAGPPAFRPAHYASHRRYGRNVRRDYPQIESEMRQNRPAGYSEFSRPAAITARGPDPRASATRRDECVLDPEDSVRFSRSRRELASVSSRVSFGEDSQRRVAGREKSFRAERQTLKPRSNNGAMVLSTEPASSKRTGLKRRCADDPLRPDRRRSVDQSQHVDSYLQSFDGPSDRVFAQPRPSSFKRRSTGRSSVHERTGSGDLTTVTFTIDDDGRAKAEKRIVAHARASFESRDHFDSDSDSAAEDFAIATSRNPSFAVVEERPRRHHRTWRRDRDASQSRRVMSQSIYAASDARYPGYGSVQHLRSARTEPDPRSGSRGQQHNQARLSHSGQYAAPIDDMASEAETLFDDEEDLSELDKEMPRMMERRPERRDASRHPSQDLSHLRRRRRPSHGRHVHSSLPRDTDWTSTSTSNQQQHHHPGSKKNFSRSPTKTLVPSNHPHNSLATRSSSHLEHDHPEYPLQCVCDMSDDEGPLIECDSCGNWQHTTCMGLNPKALPRAYVCVRCTARRSRRERERERDVDSVKNSTATNILSASTATAATSSSTTTTLTAGGGVGVRGGSNTTSTRPRKMRRH